MQNIKFIKEPGYIFDLFFLFTLYFNQEYCLKNFVNTNKEAEDRAYFEDLLSDFGDVSDELRVFFELQDNKKNFMSTYYFEPYKYDFITDEYNLDKVQVALTDYKSVVQNVIKFYCKDFENTKTVDNNLSLTVISNWIKKSKYNGEIKSALYAFFIEPLPIIRKLSYELMVKGEKLLRFYDEQGHVLNQLQRNFKSEILADSLKKYRVYPVNIDEFENLFVSFSLLNRNLVKTLFLDDGVIIQLGMDYITFVDHLITLNRLPELESFGNAVSEQNRIDILNLVHRRGEITIKEVEQELGFTGANSYYHLSLMIKVGILKSRNRGRTILYSVNEKYFDDLCDILITYSKRKKGNTENENME